MPKQIKLRELEEKMKVFHEMYDAVRLVDPVKKKVLELNNHKTRETCTFCYKYWKEGRICDNCISVRAYQENKGYMKLEQNAKECMLVTAIPIENSETPVVLELLKNTTDVLMVGSGEYNSAKPISDILYDMNKLVIKDHLTGIYNRRFVDERLPVDIIQADIANEPLSVIFIDMDNMKTINDTFGHQIGDMALKQVVSDMQSCIDPNKDWIARYGGDEFIVCLRNTGKIKAHNIANNIQDKIDNNKLKLETNQITISVSFGIHTIEDAILNANDLLYHADQNMYLMKQNKKKINE